MKRLLTGFLVVSLINLVVSEMIEMKQRNETVVYMGCRPDHGLCGKFCYSSLEPYLTLLTYDKEMKNKELKMELEDMQAKIEVLQALLDEKDGKCKTEEELSLKTSELIFKRALDKGKTELVICKANIEMKNNLIQRIKIEAEEKRLLMKERLSHFETELNNLISDSCLAVGKALNVHIIKLPSIPPFPAICDGTSLGAGWMVVQRRVDESVRFNRTWDDYKNGFGNMHGNYFMGLDYLHKVTTTQSHELHIQMIDSYNKVHNAKYDHIMIGPESDKFRLNLGKFEGDIGDSLHKSRNMWFTTEDRDNDQETEDNCACKNEGGWWFNTCGYNGFLNAPYNNQLRFGWFNPNDGTYRRLKFSQMMIRPKRFRELTSEIK